MHKSGVVSLYSDRSRHLRLFIVLAAWVPLMAHAANMQNDGLLAEPAMTLAGQSDALLLKGLNLRLDVALADNMLDADDCEEELGGTADNAAPAMHAASGASSLTAKFEPAGDTRSARVESPPVAMVAQTRSAALAAQPATASIASTWEISPSDKTLNGALARWAAAAGWQLVWELPIDYAVETSTVVHGRFDEAVSLVAKSMEGAEIPMKAIFYEGNKVLRIVAKGDK